MSDQITTPEALVREWADHRGVDVGDEDTEWWRGYRQAQRETVHSAARLADRVAALPRPDALARAKAEALREVAAVWVEDFPGPSPIARWLRDRADRIDSAEPTVAELQAEAQRLCDADRLIDPTEGTRG